MSQVDSLVDDILGTFFDLVKQASYIVAQNSNGYQLHPAEINHGKYQRRPTRDEILRIDKFVEQDPGRNQQSYAYRKKAKGGRDFKGLLREVKNRGGSELEHSDQAVLCLTGFTRIPVVIEWRLFEAHPAY